MKQLVSIFILFCFSAQAGHEVGNPVDSKDIGYQSAWFLGTRQVRYCYRLAPGFGLSASQVEHYIQAAVKNWRDYIEELKIHAQQAEYRPALIYHVLKSCDGSEDISFYLGIQNAEVNDAKTAFMNPTAFAQKTFYDLKKGWGKGFIWVAGPNTVYPKANFPDWTYGYTFQGIITHEIGHVLGIIDHVNGTIMQENLVSKLQMAADSPQRAEAILTNIDDTRALFLCSDCPTQYQGTISAFESDLEAPKTFEKMTGHKPTGKISAQFEIQNKGGTLENILTLSDKIGVHKLLMSWMPNTRTITDGAAKIFSSALEIPTTTNSSQMTGNYYFPVSEVQFGFVTSQKGVKYQVIFGRNTENIGNRPVQIKFIDGDAVKELFTASLKGLDN